MHITCMAYVETTVGLRGLQAKIPMLYSDIEQAGVCKGEAEGVYTGGVLSLNSAGLLITTFRGSSPSHFGKSATQVKITPQAKKQKKKQNKNKKERKNMSFILCCLRSMVVFWP